MTDLLTILAYGFGMAIALTTLLVLVALFIAALPPKILEWIAGLFKKKHAGPWLVYRVVVGGGWEYRCYLDFSHLSWTTNAEDAIHWEYLRDAEWFANDLSADVVALSEVQEAHEGRV